MSDEFTKERDGVRRAPPSEIAWPKGQASDERRSVAGPSARLLGGLPMLPATSGVRVLYLLALFTAFAPRPGSSWVGLAVGGGWLAVLGWSALAIAAVAVWRGVTVLLYRHRLTAPAPTGSARWLRIFGIVLMAVGVVVYVLHFGRMSIRRMAKDGFFGFIRALSGGATRLCLAGRFGMSAAEVTASSLDFDRAATIGKV